MSDFAPLDIMVPKQLHKDLYDVYAKGKQNKTKSIKAVPFERNLDLWFLGFCLAIKKGLNPIESSGQKVRAIQGVVFVNNKQQELIIKHIMVQREGVDILLDPAKMHKTANELSTAGLAELKLILGKDPDETELDNILDSMKELLEE